MNGAGRRRRGRGIRSAGLAVALTIPPMVASAQPDETPDETLVGEHVVTVHVYRDGRLEAQGAGVVVGARGEVLTSAAVLGAGTRMTVVAQGEERELQAQQQWKERDSGLGLLRVDDLQRAGLAVSVAELTPGLRVFAVTPGEGAGDAFIAAGSVSEPGTESVRGEEVGFVRHNAMIAARGYGSPVVNECFQVVGMNVPDPNAFTIFTAPRKIEPENSVFAVSGAEVAERLARRGVEFVQVADACVGVEARTRAREREAREAQQQAEARETQTQQRLEESEQRLQQAEADAQVSEQAKEEARTEAERARREMEAAQAQAAQAREATAAAERAVQEANRRAAEAGEREREHRRRSEQLRRHAQWGAAGGAALLAVLVLSWALSARRKRGAMRRAQARAAAAEREAETVRRRADAAPAPFDCLLTGTDGGGAPFAMRAGRDALGASAGVVIGRDPAVSSHVVVDPSVSREHARLSVRDGELWVEDLASTNGTYLHGQRLEAGERARAADGDELALGTVRLRVELRG